MKQFIPALAAACLSMSAATAFAHAAPAPSGERMRPTPEQHQQMKERFTAAREACKSASDQRGCMTQQFCSKAQDQAKCLEFAKKRGEHMREVKIRRRCGGLQRQARRRPRGLHEDPEGCIPESAPGTAPEGA
jgi:hypothetical protein